MTPVLLFCYNRPLHTAKTIAALQTNPESKATDLHIFVDGPKNDKDKEKVQEVRKLVNEVSGFKSVVIKESLENKGLANSVITGVSEKIEKYEQVIVLEDDMLVTKDFLSFMNEALGFYQGNKLIGSISGYSFQPQIPSDYAEGVFLCKRASSWGWGTWKDRWERVDWELQEYEQFIESKAQKEEFILGGRDLLPMIVKYKRGIIDSWAIRWTYHHHSQNQYCLVPVLSKVQNIGTDGSGTNFSNTDNKYEVEMGEKEIKLPSSPVPNQSILKSFKSVYTPSLYRRFINYLKFRIF